MSRAASHSHRGNRICLNLQACVYAKSVCTESKAAKFSRDELYTL